MPKIIWWPQMAGGFFSKIPKTETLHFFTDYIHQPLPTHQQTSSHRYPLLFAIFSEPWNNWVLGRPWKPSCCIHLGSGIHHFPLRRHGEKSTTTDRSKEPKMLRRQSKDTRLLVWFWLFAKRHADFPHETKKTSKNSNPKFWHLQNIYFIKIFKLFFLRKKYIICLNLNDEKKIRPKQALLKSTTRSSCCKVIALSWHSWDRWNHGTPIPKSFL